MARCRVSFTDSEKTEHAVEVEAESFYEAVALAAADFREDPLLREPPGAMTEFTVAVLRNPTGHKIKLQQLTKWAGRRCPRGRREYRSGRRCGRYWHIRNSLDSSCLKRIFLMVLWLTNHCTILGQLYERSLKNRMDGCDVESPSRLYQDQPRL